MRWVSGSLLVAMLALSGCESIDVPFSGEDIRLQCPGYYILEDAATLTEFRPGPGQDITDVVVRAQMGSMQIACLSDIDSDTNAGKMTIDISPVIAAEMGPANTTQSATLPYFVVITDQNKEILYREPLKLNLSFGGNKTQVIAYAAPTSVEIPITPDIRNDYYRIYSGFELTEDQVRYNRKIIQDRLR